jgi:hypothetical protein
MVVDDFDIGCVPFLPSETDAPLIVDSNAPRPASIPSELLEPIRWRNPQIRESGRGIEHAQLPQCNLLQVGREPTRPDEVE